MLLLACPRGAVLTCARRGLRRERGFHAALRGFGRASLASNVRPPSSGLVTRVVLGGSGAVVGVAALVLRGGATSVASCAAVAAPIVAPSASGTALHVFAAYEGPGWLRTLRMLWRLFTLSILSAPIFLGLPFALTLGQLVPALQDALWAYALFAVHRAGPAYIKLAQWASSRNDLFPAAFCATFSQLHDRCFPHPWRQTEAILARELGAGWRSVVALEPEVIGSGCIAQVYRGTVRAPQTGVPTDVAVKVIHPGVEAIVAVDIDILRTLAQTLARVPALKWLSLPDVVEDFALQMLWQLDLRQEARNLERLCLNFKNDKAIVIPRPFIELSTRDLLFETFQPGVPISAFIDSEACDARAKKELSRLGMNSMAKMIFIDNFVHCDLHPGNILVGVQEGDKSKLAMIFLDAGIVKELRPNTHRLMLNILQAFLQWDGVEAGRLMIENAAEQQCGDVDGFCGGIQAIIDDSKYMPFFQHFGEYTTRVFDLACTHRVKLEGNFITIALAMKVCEGLSIRLDPHVQMVQGCIPWLFKAQIAHGISISDVLFSTHNITLSALKTLNIS